MRHAPGAGNWKRCADREQRIVLITSIHDHLASEINYVGGVIDRPSVIGQSPPGWAEPRETY